MQNKRPEPGKVATPEMKGFPRATPRKLRDRSKYRPDGTVIPRMGFKKL